MKWAYVQIDLRKQKYFCVFIHICTLVMAIQFKKSCYKMDPSPPSPRTNQIEEMARQGKAKIQWIANASEAQGNDDEGSIHACEEGSGACDPL